MKVNKHVNSNNIANKIVLDLFTSGFDETADRLVLTSKDGRDLGGWCMTAAADRIADILRKSLKTKKRKT